MGPLPSFKNPPVIEVAIAAQFRPIDDLTSPRVGLLWQRYREEFPNLEVHPALEPRFERSGPVPPQNFQIEIGKHPTSRVWFVTDDKSNLIQIQQDRFVFNWRRIDGKDYPRYEHVRAKFEKHFGVFHEFLAVEQLGELKLNQWELAYVNHIPASDGWRHHGELGSVVPLLVGDMSGMFLPGPEDITLHVRYPILDGKSLCRLYVVANPAVSIPSGDSAFRLTLTARGKLGDAELRSRLDMGHEWIVRGFTEVTSQMMHQFWERER